MRWDAGDGRHEGRASSVVPDGRLSHEIGDHGVLVEGVTGRHPRDAHKRDHEVFDDDDVVGWCASCACGWTGQLWRRVGTKSKASLESRSAYVPFMGLATPPLAVEHALHAEWGEHALLAGALDELEAAKRAVAAAQSRLNIAVTRCRSSGLAWEAIASILNMTRQSAHARWRNMRG